MISKRYRRPARPQESVRQFSLNNSKGIDSTKAPTDFNTVCSAKNLIVNPDGSMSLRKPIVWVDTRYTQHRDERVYYLYDEQFIIVTSDNSFTMFSANGDPVDFILKYTDYLGDTVTVDVPRDELPPTLLFREAICIDNDAFTVTNLNTSTVLGGCTINPSKLTNFVDEDLYDSSLEDLKLPRYLRLHKPPDSHWIVEIVQPEVNTLTTAEGDFSLNPNLTLDNPTAICDTYGGVVPSVKGILAYAPAKRENGKLVLGAPLDLSNAQYLWLTAEATYDCSASVGMSESETVFVNSTNLILTSAGTENTSPVMVDYGLKLTHGTYSGRISGLCNLSSEYTQEGVYRAMLNTHYTVSAKDASERVKTYYIDRQSTSIYTGAQVVKGVNIAPECTVDFDSHWTEYSVQATYELTVELFDSKTDNGTNVLNVSEITESVRDNSYRVLTKLPSNNSSVFVILKAFCNLPKPNTEYYAAWFKSSDGIRWSPLNTFEKTQGIDVRELNPDWTPDPNIKDDKPTANDYSTVIYYPLHAESKRDDAFGILLNSRNEYVVTNYRIDVANAAKVQNAVSDAQMYRFKIIAVEPLTPADVEWDSFYNTEQYRIKTTVAQSDYTPVFGPEAEFLDIEFGNPVLGKHLYHKKALYAYGSENFFNNIFVSDIDSFITPLYNIIDLDATSATRATCIIPWRDYLLSATDSSIYLHSKLTDGFLTKTVNTSIGIPEYDSRCCKAILNGVLFKSGSKVYQLYPNMYAGDDSMLNLTEISKAVAEILESYEGGKYAPFAFSTESEYILMLPNDDEFKALTTCLRYEYASKLWTVCTYPIVAIDYRIVNFNDIRIFGIVNDRMAEFQFDSNTVNDTYGDVLPTTSADGHSEEPRIFPIDFEWDTGQKTDSISVTKQFVESKLMFATEDNLEAFPMELTVHVDGDPHITTLDLNSDAPFWKEDGVRSLGVANTAFRLGNSTSSGILRQLIVRYSGKGRSVRHILRGSPTSNFRLYETYVRYKTLNVKR